MNEEMGSSGQSSGSEASIIDAVLRAPRRILWIWVIVVFLGLPAFPAEGRGLPHVIVLNSYHFGFEWSDAEVSGLLERLREDYPRIDLPVEYLDAVRHPDPDNLVRMKEFLLGKYREKQADLVVCLDNPALDMLLGLRSGLFPDAPIVFAGIDEFTSAVTAGLRRVTGVVERMDVRGTLETAIALHPDAKRVLVVGDRGESSLACYREMEDLAPAYSHRVSIGFLPSSTYEEAAARIGSLPADSLVLLLPFITDRLGRSASPSESTRLLTSKARVPVYCATGPSRLGHGIVGGRLLGGREHGRRAADIALRILSGENPDRIPVDRGSTARPMFDYDQLKRFGIPFKALPEGSFIHNKPVSLFESHGRVVAGFLVVMTILAAMVLFMALSIMRRRRAEVALRESEHKFRLVVQNAEAIVFILDRTGVFLLSEGRALAKLGLSPGQVVGVSALEMYRENPSIFESIRKALAGEIVHVENEVDGACFKTVYSPYRNLNGELDGVMGIAIDITDRKQAEQALAESEERYRLLFQYGNDAIFVLDSETLRIVDCNQRATEMVGYGPEELRQMTIEQIHPLDERSMVQENCHSVSVVGSRCGMYDMHYLCKDGRIADIEVSGVQLQLGGRSVKMTVARDVTEKKRVEEEKAKLESQLVQAQRIESIGRLAGGVAHDFNNMLSVILGYSELIKSQLPPDAPMLHDILEIEKAAAHSSDITRQLLAFSRKQLIAPRPINLNHQIAQTQKTLSRLIGEDIDLNFLPGKDLRPIRFDPSQLDQILMNLAVNGRDAMPDGGRLTIQTANVAMDDISRGTRYFLPPGEYVLLELADDGIGMDREILSHIFEPFFTTKELGRGTGLGLATVYGIVKQNAGFIDVYSEPGKGTSFKIYFPAITVSEEPLRKTTEPAIASGSGTVLLVEDEEQVRTLIEEVLKVIGYTVLSAGTPHQALSLCEKKETRIDLLITDVVMPEMNGAELRDRIAAIRPGIRTLFMSGYSEEVVAHRGVLKEGVHFIQKPFSMKNIARKIGEALRNG